MAGLEEARRVRVLHNGIQRVIDLCDIGIANSGRGRRARGVNAGPVAKGKGAADAVLPGSPVGIAHAHCEGGALAFAIAPGNVRHWLTALG